MTSYRLCKLVLAGACIAAWSSLAGGQGTTDQSTATPAAEGPPALTEEYLNAPENIEAGKQIWQQQCRHCHGSSAYPGKAPKLKPRRYKPEFVYKRVTNGFRKMPAWKDVYTDDERMAIVAWIMSAKFAP